MTEGRDPLMADDWVADPWDDVTALAPDSTEEQPPSGDWLRGPARHLVVVLVATLLLLGAGALWVVHQLNPGVGSRAAVTFTVNDGDTLGSVAARLDDAGIIENRTLFRWYARTRGGIALLPGYYALRPGDSAGNIVDALSTPPDQTFVKVTFPEGYTVAQMAGRLVEKVTYMTSGDFTTAASDGSIPSTLAPEGAASLEGLLFPDTYQVSGDDTEARVVGRLAQMMERVARQERLVAGARLLGLSPYKVLTVASMVEKEAKTDVDRPKIARVIYNRLARGMKLEIDATLLYGADPSASFADLKAADGPYNSYTRKGLPPTPIANPGRASIKAALAPAPPPTVDDEACRGLPKGTKCEYLYYVLSDEEGGHTFATTYEQHLANIETSRAAGILP
ncbi:MAG: endolytic transglycosylase MltG [Acidimicrobiales bacterium]